MKLFQLKGTWAEVRDICLFTANRPMEGKEPSSEWKTKLLIAEHSPVRSLWVRWIWTSVAHWVGVHFTRHIWPCFVQTQRTDRTGVPREKLPQDQPQGIYGEANPQHLIDTSRKRLCRQASQETRWQWEGLKLALHEQEPEIADVMVPNCVYRGGCPELLQGTGCKCHYYENLLTRHPDLASTDIRRRYDAYNRIFYGAHDGRENI